MDLDQAPTDHCVNSQSNRLGRASTGSMVNIKHMVNSKQEEEAAKKEWLSKTSRMKPVHISSSAGKGLILLRERIGSQLG